MKADRKSFKKVAKYSVAYVLGIATVGAVWWVTYVPPENRYFAIVSPHYVDTGKDIIPSVDMHHYMSRVLVYLYEPLYRFKKQEGINMLERVAAVGSIDAMNHLFKYYERQLHISKNNQVANEQMLYWARQLADAGYPWALVFLTTPTVPYPLLTPQDVARIEEYAVNYQDIADALASYYAGEYSQHLSDVAEKQAWWAHYVANNETWLPPVDMPTLKQQIYQR